MEDIQKPEQPAAPEVTAPQQKTETPKQEEAPKQVEGFYVPAQVMGVIYTFIRKRPHEEVDDLITAIKNNIKPIYKQD